VVAYSSLPFNRINFCSTFHHFYLSVITRILPKCIDNLLVELLFLFHRRDLAPHLKSLMGPWWFSQFDPVFEVSQAAKRSLQVRFHKNYCV
jgi:hypothetical protein